MVQAHSSAKLISIARLLAEPSRRTRGPGGRRERPVGNGYVPTFESTTDPLRIITTST